MLVSNWLFKAYSLKTDARDGTVTCIDALMVNFQDILSKISSITGKSTSKNFTTFSLLNNLKHFVCN